MVELSTKRDLSKEELTALLREVVQEAHKKDNSVLGVIVFGSRTHEGMARPNSDVDLIPVLRTISSSAEYVLRDSEKRILAPFDLIKDHKSTIYLDWIDQALMLQTGDEVESIHRRCRWIDKDSIFVIVDHDAERKIREFVKPEQRM